MVIGHVLNVKYVLKKNSLMRFLFLIYYFKKITQSSSSNIKHHSMNEFHTMLKYALRRMKSHPQVGFLN